MMRRAIAFLEPNSVTLLGYETADREKYQLLDFKRGLRVRMGSVLFLRSYNPKFNPDQVSP